MLLPRCDEAIVIALMSTLSTRSQIVEAIWISAQCPARSAWRTRTTPPCLPPSQPFLIPPARWTLSSLTESKFFNMQLAQILQSRFLSRKLFHLSTQLQRKTRYKLLRQQLRERHRHISVKLNRLTLQTIWPLCSVLPALIGILWLCQFCLQYPLPAQRNLPQPFGPF